jgi:serine/threonine protein kinase
MFVCAECGASQPVPGNCGADRSPLQPIGDDRLLGQTIGAYRVARLLGIGGMGRVYKGVHPQIGSRVAIKVLSRECSDRRDLVERFFAEAKAVNLIRHESIVNVLDLATLPDGRPYIVMEYLDGSSLAGIIDHAKRSGMPLPLGGLARLVAEVLDALGAAHATGIIHRDLKPDNIYVTPGGRAKVLDFGIAKLQPAGGAASGSSTHTGSLLGTPHYMSPEQAAGRPVDTRADIYAIGVILFECATLQKPFVADSLFDLLRKHVEAPPPSPRALRADMPESLEHIIYAALAKQPDERFASTHAMSMALQHATANLPQQQWTTIVPTSSGRNPAIAWQPTPPASWAGSQKGPNVANGPTQTEGQVTRGTKHSTQKGSSKKGLWLALGALVLVGGGVAAGVMVSGGNTTQVVASGSGSSTTASAPEGSAQTGSAPGNDAPAPPAVVPDDDDDDDAADKEEDDKERREEFTEADASDVMDEMFANMDPSMLPPEAAAAIKKYGTWAKIPKRQRTKILGKMVGQTMGIATRAGHDVNRILSGEDPLGSAPPPPPPKPTPAPKAAEGLDSDGWVKRREFKLGGGYDPTKLSLEKHMPLVQAEAKKLVPDAVLFRVDINGVFSDGRVDITAKEDGKGSIDFRFISPKRASIPDPTPGTPDDRKCTFRVELDKSYAWSAPLTSFDCKELAIGPPRCTTAQIWEKAKAAGAPTDKPADLGYRTAGSKQRTWYFSIRGTSFSTIYDDDCKAAGD